MENLVLDRPIIEEAQTKSQDLWEIVTGLTRLYFSNPNPQAVKDVIGENDYQHLMRINRKLLRK